VQLEGFIDASAMLQGGVYALVHRGVVVYVGKSKVMLGRVYTHRVAWGKKSKSAVGLKPQKGILFDAIWVRPCPLTDIDELESAMINLYKPRYNSMLRNGLPVDISALISALVSTHTPAPRPLKPEGTILRRV
jgi:excinuclease UvrABC nuclease subunit